MLANDKHAISEPVINPLLSWVFWYLHISTEITWETNRSLAAKWAKSLEVNRNEMVCCRHIGILATFSFLCFSSNGSISTDGCVEVTRGLCIGQMISRSRQVYLPFAHGINDKPSGRLPSSRARYDGSSRAAEFRLTIKLVWWGHWLHDTSRVD
jgi:hypothetical protein